MRIWKERWQGDTSPHALALRDRLVSSYIRSEALTMTNMRAAQAHRKSGTPGPEGSVAKLAFAEENKRVYDLCMDLLGNDGMLFPAGYPMVRPDWSAWARPTSTRCSCGSGPTPSRAARPRSCATSWASGCSACPGDVRTDKELAWKDVPRS